jgi:uncharacterized membrane protein
MTHSIRVVSIIEHVAAETRQAIRATRPDELPPAAGFDPGRPADAVLCFQHAPGYLLGVDEDDLVRVAVAHHCVLRVPINDPTTAVQCLDRIHDLLRRITVRPTPSGCHHGPDGRVRLVVPVVMWDELVALALDEIRQYGHSSIQVHRRIRSMIADLSTVATAEHRPALERQHKLLEASADRAFSDIQDRRAAEPAGVTGVSRPR